jgi:branched-chain amino acid transport system substrate-binding protein
MRRVLLSISLAVAVLPASGCGDDEPEPARVMGGTLTVYASLPAHGPTAALGREAEIGMRRALADAGGQAGGRRVRFVSLPATRPGDAIWDPGTVEANAERAADDPTAIAYLGELDQGGSAVSLPVTNRAGILQLSPADGLTSLGRSVPGQAQDLSERYYPTDEITFGRLVPPDLDAAREIVAALEERRVRRLGIVQGGGIADRELEGMVVEMYSPGGDRVPAVTRLAVRDADAEHVAELIEELAAERPDAILYAGRAGAEARAVLAGLAARLPDVPVMGGPPLAAGGRFARVPAGACAWTGVPPPSELPPRGRRLLAELRRESRRELGSEAILGYAAMDVALAAIERGGPNRRRVVSAARDSVDWDEVIVGHGLGTRAHIEGISAACVELEAGE